MPHNFSKLSNEELRKIAGIDDTIEKPLDFSQMSDEELQKIAGTEPKKPNRPLHKEALRQVGRTGRAVATGIAGLADIPNLAALSLHAAGFKEKPTFYEPVAPWLQNKIDTLTGGKLKPEGKGEEYVDAIVEGLAPMALTGGASLAAKIAGRGAKKGLTRMVQSRVNPHAITKSNVAGSVGSSVALKHYIDNNEDPGLVGALVASGLGSSAGRGLMKLKNPRNAAAEVIGRATGFEPSKYAKNVELGLPVTPGTVSEKRFPKQFEMIAAKTPGSIDKYKEFYKNRESKIAQNLGILNPEDLEGAVKNINKSLAKKGAEDYKERINTLYKKREEKFGKRVKEAKENREMVDVSNLYKELSDKAKGLSTEAELKDFKKTPAGQFKESLEGYFDTGLTKEELRSLKKQKIPESLVTGQLPQKEISYGGLDALRKEALDLKESLVRGSSKRQEVSGIEHELSDLRHKFMEETGNALESHNAQEARKLWRRYADKNNSNMKKYVYQLTGEDTDTGAFNKLTNHEKMMSVAMHGLDKNKDKRLLTEAVIADLGNRQGRFNLNTAYTGFHKLEEPVREKLLSGFTKEEKKNFLGTMELIGENKQMMEELSNTSNTAHTHKVMAMLSGATGAIGSLVATGNIKPALEIILAYSASVGGARLFTNQNFMKRVHKVMTAKTPKAQGHWLKNLVALPIVKNAIRVGQQSGKLTIDIDNRHMKPHEEKEN